MPTIVGRYELRDELGRGGMASVYRAYDATLNREVALKVMAGHLATDTGFQRRFEREAQVIALLEHPNIVPVYDYGITAAGQPYLVMRLLRGGTLYDRMARGRIPQAQLWPIMRQIASALDYAHDRDIVHRDIKPVNVLFDEKGNAYVSDFGIAKVRDATTNLTGNSILGTPAYMSPEQFMGMTLDGRSDQYSLAVMLFEALSGRPPFASDTLQGLMFQHINEPPPDIHALDTTLTPAMSAVLRRALAKHPGDRFPAASDFIEMMEAATTATGPSGADEKRRQQLASYYDAGVKAYRSADWPVAVDFLGRVISLDTGYRDAAQLHQTARYRLQEQRGVVPATELAAGNISRDPTQYVPGAGGPVGAPATVALPRRSRWPLLLVLLVLLLGGAAAAYFLWLRETPEPAAQVAAPAAIDTATPTVEPSATLPPPEPTPVAGAALVVEAGAASLALDNGRAQPLANGAEVPLRAGTHAALAVDDGPTQLVLPTGARLYLDAGTEIGLTATVQGDPLVTLERGRLAAWSHDAPVTVGSAFDGRAALLEPGLMGMTMNPGAVSFEVACLEGSCDVQGANDAQPLHLRDGQTTVVGVEGFADRPTTAEGAAYEALVDPESLPTAEAVVDVSPTTEPTATPTDNPTEAPTEAAEVVDAVATDAPTRATSGTSGSGSNTTVLGSGTAVDFETFGTWRRGTQETGTLEQSSAQSHGGRFSAALNYDFVGAAGEQDFLVYIQEHPIEGEPNLIRLWVYGDGSGHNVNAWIRDDEGEIWQVPLGRATHQGWRQMEGRIDTDQDWPWTHISGPDNGEVDFPISFHALVVDRRAATDRATGTIYVDDLTVATGAPTGGATAAPGATAAAVATPAAGDTPTPTSEPPGAAGAIIFTAGDSLLTADPGGAPRILGPADRNSCSGDASTGGITYRLAAPAAGCYPIGHGQVVCIAPDGVTQALVGPAPAGTSARPILIGGQFIVDADLDEDEGLIWAPNSGSLLYVVGGEVFQAFSSGGYQRVISGVPGITCPRWTVR